MEGSVEYYLYMYKEFYDYIKRKRIYVTEAQIKDLGDLWKETLKYQIGKYTRSKEKGTSLNTLYDELVSLFPQLFYAEDVNDCDQLRVFIRVVQDVLDTRRNIRSVLYG